MTVTFPFNVSLVIYTESVHVEGFSSFYNVGSTKIAWPEKSFSFDKAGGPSGYSFTLTLASTGSSMTIVAEGSRPYSSLIAEFIILG